MTLWKFRDEQPLYTENTEKAGIFKVFSVSIR
jgi:hypothetical protein